MVSQLRTFAAEVTRVALEVGTEGILGGQATVEGVQGVWADLTTNVNVSVRRDCIDCFRPLTIARRTWLEILPTKSAPSQRSRQPSRMATLERRSWSMSGERCWI